MIVNRYERDSRNRAACLAVHGHKCAVCRFDFGKVFGDLGRGFIHVHHIVGMSMREGKVQRPDPRLDLRPVCPTATPCFILADEFERSTN